MCILINKSFFYRTILFKQTCFFSLLGVVCIFCWYQLSLLLFVECFGLCGEWCVEHTQKKVDTNMQMNIFTRYKFTEWILTCFNGFNGFALNFWCNFTMNEHYCQLNEFAAIVISLGFFSFKCNKFSRHFQLIYIFRI